MTPLLDRYQVDTLKNNPLVFYRMREGTGTTMLDYTSNANNGTYSGTGISWIPGGAASSWNGQPQPSGKNVPIFNSYYAFPGYSPTVPLFDGAAGRATATLNSPAINTAANSKVTVEMWARWDGTLSGTNGTFEALANFGGATGILLGFLKNGAADYRFGISIRNSGDLWGLNNATTLAVIQKDVYHHFVFVLVNNAIQTSKLYIDGVQYTMTQQIGTTTTTDSVTNAFAIGYDGTASFFGGSPGEVAVYNGEPYPTVASVNNRYNIGAFGGDTTDQAAIPGIESLIEISQFGTYPFVMNDKIDANGNPRRTLDNYYISDIGGLDDADLRFDEDPNFYQSGATPLNTLAGGRTITFDGYIDASNFKSLRNLQGNLRKAFTTINPASPANGLVEVPLIFRNVWDNGFDMTVNAKKSSPLQMKEAQTNYMAQRSFLITMRASFPYFESVGSRTEVVQVGATVIMNHKGNSYARPTVTFWGPFSSMTFVLGNTININATVSVSTSIVVDAKARTASDWSKYGTNDFPFLSPSSTNVAWLMSVAGASAGVTKVEVNWKHTVV